MCRVRAGAKYWAANAKIKSWGNGVNQRRMLTQRDCRETVCNAPPAQNIAVLSFPRCSGFAFKSI